MRNIEIRRATLREADSAYEIVQEYYEAARVVARDSREEFARFYFGDGSGVWLAVNDTSVVGCIALRPLPQLGDCGEVKRLYVRDAHRGRGIAHALHEALQSYAAGFGYEWLYLDTAKNMTAALRFYEAHGYERCERYNDNPQAAIFMRKELHPRRLSRNRLRSNR
jgi:GNAT superfamily N-acetyltransferase